MKLFIYLFKVKVLIRGLWTWTIVISNEYNFLQNIFLIKKFHDKKIGNDYNLLTRFLKMLTIQ